MVHPHRQCGEKGQQRLFNLRRLKKCFFAPKTFPNLYRCTIESILSGCITTWYATAPPSIAELSRGWCGLPNTSSGENYLPSKTHTAPNVTGRPKRSSSTSTTRATACSQLPSRRQGQYMCIKAGTKKLKNSFSQGHQTVK